LDKATANITKFFNAEDQVKLRTERKQFISSLDANLLTSPASTPLAQKQPEPNNFNFLQSQTTTNLADLQTP